MKLAITSEGETLQSSMDLRFGRTKFFIVFDTETQMVVAIPNAVNLSAVQGAGIQAGKAMVGLGVEAVITGHVGPKAFEALKAGNIKVYTSTAGTVADAIEQMKAGQLQAAQSSDTEGRWRGQ
jgi:predicted Fe-Mo cluster-binding NifX family protein